MERQSETERLAEHLRQVIRRSGHDLKQLSHRALGRAPDYLSKALRGERRLAHR